eukprot:c3718_g1_i2.p1 GENE.c3718_g1_i2~~c3718_g1_i2.p1  ORF type:complete len:227 (+),score=15.92 c3718_g1_i2:101-781(+)
MFTTTQTLDHSRFVMDALQHGVLNVSNFLISVAPYFTLSVTVLFISIGMSFKFFPPEVVFAMTWQFLSTPSLASILFYILVLRALLLHILMACNATNVCLYLQHWTTECCYEGLALTILACISSPITFDLLFCIISFFFRMFISPSPVCCSIVVGAVSVFFLVGSRYLRSQAPTCQRNESEEVLDWEYAWQSYQGAMCGIDSHLIDWSGNHWQHWIYIDTHLCLHM